MKNATILLTPNSSNSSIYVEDNELVSTEVIKASEWDSDGRYIIGVLGYFKVTPDMFNVTSYKTYDGSKTYLKYTLTDEGWDKLDQQGLKHPGRGWVLIELIPSTQIDEIIDHNNNMMKKLSDENIKLTDLI